MRESICLSIYARALGTVVQFLSHSFFPFESRKEGIKKVKARMAQLAGRGAKKGQRVDVWDAQRVCG